MNISVCILDYLKQFGAVTVPAFGVFSVENSKAIINSENGSILPPAGRIAFVLDYEVYSDDLAGFIAGKKQSSLEVSKRDLKIQTDFWKKKLQAEQLLEIQNLGVISIDEVTTHFKGKRVQTDHPDFYGLEEIKISEINRSELSAISENTEKDYKFSTSILWIFMIIVPVLGVCYLAYTQQELLFGKKSFENVSVQTKTHRIVDTLTLQVHTLPIQVSDSLKKDSLSETKEKRVKMPSNQTNSKTTWQK